MPNYDLGTAHGSIVVDYDNKGTAQASKDFTSLGKSADSLGGHISGLGSVISDFGRNWGSIAQNAGRNFSLLAGGAGIITALTLSFKGLAGGTLGLKSGITTLRALRTVIGGVPKSIQGFPNVLKQIVLLSAGLSLFGGGIKILEQLAQRFTLLQRAIPILKNVADGLEKVAKPTRDIAKLILTIGTFISAAKNVLALAQAVGKLSAMIAALQGGIQIVSLLAGAIEQLSGAAGLLPGIFFAGAVSAGVFKLALSGVSKAFKDIGNPKKFAKDMADLAPAAQDFVKAIVALKSQFKSLQLDVQNRFFNGFGDIVKQIAHDYLPLLHKNLGNIAGDFNNFGKDLGEWLGWPMVINDVNSSLGNVHKAIANLEGAWIAVLHIFDDLVTVSTSFLPRLALWISQAAGALAGFVDGARASGQLAQWIQTGIDAFKLLGQILINIFSILSSVFSAFGAGGAGFLNTVARLTGALADFFNSAKGSQALTALAGIFSAISTVVRNVLIAALEELGPIVVQLLPIIQELAQDFGGSLIVAIRILGGLLQALVQILNILSPVLSPFAGTIFALTVTLLGVAAAFRAVWTVVVLVTTAIKIIEGVIVVFRSVVLSLQVAFWLLDAGMLGTMATIGLFIGIFLAIALVVALVVIVVIKYWTQIKSFLTTVWNFISALAVKVWGHIADFFTSIWTKVANFFKSIWTDVSTWFQNLWDNILNFVTSIANKIWNFLKTWGTLILAVFFPMIGIPLLIIQHWGQIIDFFQMLGSKIVEGLAALPGIIGKAFLWAMTRGLYYVEQGLEWIIAALIAFPIDAVIYIIKFGVFLAQAIAAGMKAAEAAVVAGLLAISVWFVQLPGRLLGYLAGFETMLITWITGVWAGFMAWNQQASVAVFTWFQALPGRIISGVSSLLGRIGTWISSVWTGLANWNARAGIALTAWFQALPGRIISAVASLSSRIGSWIASVWTNFANWNAREGNNVTAWFRALPGRILSMLGDLGSLLVNAGKAIIHGLLKGLEAAAGALWNFIGGIGDKIAALKGPLPYDKQLLIPAGMAIIGGLHNAMQAALPAVLSFVKTVGPQIQDAMGQVNSNIGLNAQANVATTTAATNAATATAANNVALANAANARPQQPSTPTAQPAAGNTYNIAALNVAGNLDPTNPVAWRQTLKNLKDDLRDLDRSA